MIEIPKQIQTTTDSEQRKLILKRVQAKLWISRSLFANAMACKVRHHLQQRLRQTGNVVYLEQYQ